MCALKFEGYNKKWATYKITRIDPTLNPLELLLGGQAKRVFNVKCWGWSLKRIEFFFLSINMLTFFPGIRRRKSKNHYVGAYYITPIK